MAVNYDYDLPEVEENEEGNYECYNRGCESHIIDDPSDGGVDGLQQINSSTMSQERQNISETFLYF